MLAVVQLAVPEVCLAEQAEALQPEPVQQLQVLLRALHPGLVPTPMFAMLLCKADSGWASAVAPALWPVHLVVLPQETVRL